MNRITMTALAVLISACSDNKFNYEFKADAGLIYILSIYQDEVPTPSQVISMAEAAGRSRWSFCAKHGEATKHECVYGDAFIAKSYPNQRSCLAALRSVNAILKREPTTDQVNVCDYSL